MPDAVTTLDGGSVRVDFQIGDPPRVLSDALYYSADDYAALTPDAKQAAKQARLDAWVAVLDAPEAPADEPQVDSVVEG
jgi:hypothetical protein